MTILVLDTSALLALLNAEAGAAEVGDRLKAAASVRMSSINLGELASKLVDYRKPATEAGSIVRGLGIAVTPVGVQDAIEIGRLRKRGRAVGLSLADRACLVLGARLRATVLTADREWSAVDFSGYKLLRGGGPPEIVQIRD